MEFNYEQIVESIHHDIWNYYNPYLDGLGYAKINRF